MGLAEWATHRLRAQKVLRDSGNRETNVNTGLLIGGERVDGAEGERIVVLNPATGEPITDVAAGTPRRRLTAAVDVAASAQRGWADTAPRVRSEILRAAWQSLVDHTDELAELIVKEHGKPLADAKGEVAYAAEFFRWNAEETVRIQGSLGTSPSGNNKIIVQHPPMGVVVMVTPWNFPAAMITRKLAPALGAGNAVVIKPPRETPLTALRIGELLEDVGLPPGLVNIVATTNSGAWFDAAVDNTHTRMVSFTGSTEVGRVLLRRCADRVLKTVMELGGNCPLCRVQRRRSPVRCRRRHDRQNEALSGNLHSRKSLLRGVRHCSRVHCGACRSDGRRQGWQRLRTNQSPAVP